MATTTQRTIKYKIRIEFRHMTNGNLKLSVTKGAAESKRKRKKKAVTIFYPLKLFISRLRKQTEIFATSAQFKSISEVLALFLKLNFGTPVK